MRALKISIVLLLITIVGSIWYVYAIKNTSESLLNEIKVLEEYVYSNNWIEANTKLNMIEKVWYKKEKWLTLLIDHQHIDEIKTSLAKLSQYLYFEEKADFLAEEAVLKLFIQDISARENLNFSNIF